MRFNPTKLLFGFLGLSTAVALGGTVSGSLAWYAYATRANMYYSGTSVFDSGQLMIGLKSKEAIPELLDEAYGMDEQYIDGFYYYFAPEGEGLDSNIINVYLDANGYATNELTPVTSGIFNPTPTAAELLEYPNIATFGLKQSPNSENYGNTRVAEKVQFSKITFAFKVCHETDSGTEYLANQEIWLTNAQTRASLSSSGNVCQSMRMYVDRRDADYDNDFIFNPSASDAGATKVAGLLNLGYGEFYDFDANGEILYGDYSILDGVDDGMIETNYSGPDEIANINETGDNTPTTFVAKHSPASPGYYPNFDKVDIKTAKYAGVNTIKPHKDSSGNLSNVDENNPTSVCRTTIDAGVYGYIGEFDGTIYLEGWDFSVIDEEQRHKFDFSLRFEINRV